MYGGKQRHRPPDFYWVCSVHRVPLYVLQRCSPSALVPPTPHPTAPSLMFSLHLTTSHPPPCARCSRSRMRSHPHPTYRVKTWSLGTRWRCLGESCRCYRAIRAAQPTCPCTAASPRTTGTQRRTRAGPGGVGRCVHGASDADTRGCGRQAACTGLGTRPPTARGIGSWTPPVGFRGRCSSKAALFGPKVPGGCRSEIAPYRFARARYEAGFPLRERVMRRSFSSARLAENKIYLPCLLGTLVCALSFQRCKAQNT